MRILIVDDEAPARARLRRLLGSEPDVSVAGEAETGVAAVDAIVDLAPDLVFLDVQMPGLDGFGVVAAVGTNRMPPVIFVTAYDEHAVRAFEIHAVDYLLKPVTVERCHGALERARQRMASRERPSETGLEPLLQVLAPALASSSRFLQRVLVHDERRALFLPVASIDRVEADGNYVRLVHGAVEYRLRSTMSALAERLDPGQFLQLSRSTLVRLDAVKELHPWSHGDYRVVLHDGTTLTWSRRYRAQREGEFGG